MTKIKALGLGLLAVLAVSGFSVVSAPAESGGHFTHDALTNHAVIVGTESEPDHKFEFRTSSAQIACTEASYTGTMAAKTVESLTVTPSWQKCFTTGQSGTHFEIHENGCQLTFRIGREGQVGGHTLHTLCPFGQSIQITHPNCTIRLPIQTVAGTSYQTVTEGGKHRLTVIFTAKGVTMHYESGICVFLGTTHAGEVTGGITLRAEDTPGNVVNFTATTGPKI